jgi:hypothetical protein
MPLDPISIEYISLSFAIERVFPGFIDAYVGPEEIKTAALADPEMVPAHLLQRATTLDDQIDQGGYPDARAAYLHAQVRAMVAICRKLTGEPLDYRDEVRQLFDIEPEYTPESVFDEAIAQLDAALPGTGDVAERMISWRKQDIVSTETARALVDLIVAEVRRRTEAFVVLPNDGGVEIVFVSDKPWSGYNWYLGDCRSKVELNTDLPIRASDLTSLMAHEAYPGHHAEHAIKELVLFRERGYGEHAIQLINTPECVISEGIATLAESIVFPGDQAEAWLRETIYPAAGLTVDAERETAIAKARTALRAVGGNAALRLHAEGESEDAVVDYLRRYNLRTEHEARQSLRFIADPLWRPYIFAYHVGRDLLRAWLALTPATERQVRFGRLLAEQVTPSQLATQVAAGKST